MKSVIEAKIIFWREWLHFYTKTKLSTHSSTGPLLEAIAVAHTGFANWLTGAAAWGT